MLLSVPLPSLNVLFIKDELTLFTIFVELRIRHLPSLFFFYEPKGIVIVKTLGVMNQTAHRDVESTSGKTDWDLCLSPDHNFFCSAHRGEESDMNTHTETQN